MKYSIVTAVQTVMTNAISTQLPTADCSRAQPIIASAEQLWRNDSPDKNFLIYHFLIQILIAFMLSLVG